MKKMGILHTKSLILLTVIVSTTCCNYKQANNAYIFPGFGLGVVISGAVRVSDDMVLAAGKHNLQDFRKEDHSFLFDSCHWLILRLFVCGLDSWSTSGTGNPGAYWERPDLPALLHHQEDFS
jgi:hypothetical protein